MRPKPPSDALGPLRDFVARHPHDLEARLRLGRLLLATGERAATRALLEPIEAAGGEMGAQVTAELAVLDEEEGLTEEAAARWERLLADDIDHPEARARLARLRAPGRQEIGLSTCEGGVVAAPTLASPEGMTLLRYQIVREIGRGGSSTVYLALDLELGIPLALKVLHPQLAAVEHSEACRRFFQEARVAAGLRHPGVVAIYDLDEPTRTLVMEHLAGGTLRDRMGAVRGTALPPAEVHAAASTMLAALAHVHARGVVHGDLTPRNVLLRAPGEAVLADFGNARLLEGATGELPAGTPLYLAPEQFRGAPSSPATDLFAVGTILWEALCGRPMRVHADLMNNRLDAAPLPADVRATAPAALVEIVATLTASDPAQRPASAAEALVPLVLASS
jgi:serine/threonine protein kinase